MSVIDTIYKTLNVEPDGIATVVRLSQNENGREIIFEVLNCTVPVGSTVTLSGTKPDGNVYSLVGSISDNAVTFAEDIQMTAVGGQWDAKVIIVNGGNTVATGRVRMIIDPDTVDPDAVPSSSQLEGLVAQCEAYAEMALAAAEAYVTPEMFGAVGDGIEDDTTAIQDCLDSGEKVVVFGNNKTYKVTSAIHIFANTHIYLNGSKIVTANAHLFYNFDADDVITGYSGEGNITIENGTIEGGSISFIHAENIVFRDLQFLNCVNNHIIEICACKYFLISNCKFAGMSNATGTKEYINIDPCYNSNFPWLNNSACYDGTPNQFVTIDGCTFELGMGTYAYGQDAIGVHSVGTTNGTDVDPATTTNHSHIRITNNYINGFSAQGIRANCMDDVVISGNHIITDNTVIAVQIGAWKACTDVSIYNNVFENTRSTVWYFFRIESAGVDGLSIYDNEYKRTGGARFQKIDPSYIGATTTFNLKKLDEEMIFSSNGNTKFAITQFNTLTLFTGAISSGTFMGYTIRSYPSQKFEVGKSYPYIYDNSGTLALGTFTVSTDTTYTSTVTLVEIGAALNNSIALQ